MALHWKLVIDCRDPHALADFWAAALEYTVEDPGMLVEQLLAAGQLPEALTLEHGGTRRFRGLAAIRHPDDAYDEVSGTGQGGGSSSRRCRSRRA
ncbi:VOC family protein [Leucobacter soli]|uniref:VOC family protein n=1 Tax=Leucobacter soli TaxID=2812850 RepID=UPI00361B303D